YFGAHALHLVRRREPLHQRVDTAGVCPWRKDLAEERAACRIWVDVAAHPQSARPSGVDAPDGRANRAVICAAGCLPVRNLRADARALADVDRFVYRLTQALTFIADV